MLQRSTLGLALAILLPACGSFEPRSTDPVSAPNAPHTAIDVSRVRPTPQPTPDVIDVGWLEAHRKADAPRLFVDQNTFAAVRKLEAHDAALAAWLTDLRREADAILDRPPVTRVVEGRRMLRVARTAAQRLLTLSLIFRLDGDPRHRDRAIKELRAVLAFDDWNPSHFLDTAELAVGVAVAQDWFHDDLPNDLRQEIRRVLFTHVLEPVIGPDAPSWWWRDAPNNWNSICWNGVAVAALTLAKDHPEAAAAALTAVRRHNPRALATYAPDGVYPEGPSYWNFGTTHQVMLIDALQTALGTDIGLTSIEPGFMETDRFLVHATAPSGRTFNFADADPQARRRNEPTLEWFAWAFGRRYDTIAARPLPPELVSSRASVRFEPLRVVWYARHATAPNQSAQPEALPLAWHGRGPQPVAMFRSSWTDPDAAYLGTKGGRASVNHGQMDAGGFVFEALGVRWAHDLGRQDYHDLESQRFERLFDRDQTGPRWSLFRMGPFSHNTLTVDGRLHDVRGTGRLVDVRTGPAYGEATYDLSDVLLEDGAWFRGFRLDHAGAVTVADRLSGLRPRARVRWAMLTRADIAIADDARSAALTQDGRRLRVEIRGPEGFRFRVAPARQEPPFPFDEPNPGFALLLLEGEADVTGSLTIRVGLYWDLDAAP
ncbi:MAG: heparinase II/III family protein [Planctomycetota bacterium]